MALQFVLEAVDGRALDEMMRDDFTAPLGMTDTFFNRGNRDLGPELMQRTAVTEYQIEVLGSVEPQRSQPVWGTVGYCTIES